MREQMNVCAVSVPMLGCLALDTKPVPFSAFPFPGCDVTPREALRHCCVSQAACHVRRPGTSPILDPRAEDGEEANHNIDFRRSQATHSPSPRPSAVICHQKPLHDSMHASLGWRGHVLAAACAGLVQPPLITFGSETHRETQRPTPYLGEDMASIHAGRWPRASFQGPDAK